MITLNEVFNNLKNVSGFIIRTIDCISPIFKPQDQEHIMTSSRTDTITSIFSELTRCYR